MGVVHDSDAGASSLSWVPRHEEFWKDLGFTEWTPSPPDTVPLQYQNNKYLLSLTPRERDIVYYWDAAAPLEYEAEELIQLGSEEILDLCNP